MRSTRDTEWLGSLQHALGAGRRRKFLEEIGRGTRTVADGKVLMGEPAIKTWRTIRVLLEPRSLIVSLHLGSGHDWENTEENISY